MVCHMYLTVHVLNIYDPQTLLFYFNRMKILSTLRVLADNVPGLGILLSKYMSCFQPLVYHKITFIIMIVPL